MFENRNENKQNDIKRIDSVAKIKVIGVGGGGNNTIHSMVKEGIQGVEFIVANTDEQILNTSIADTIIPLGSSAAGLGAGAKPEEGKKAALESVESIKEAIKGADMIILSAGMGGGTGTGAAPVIAKIARDMGMLTVGIVTTPFMFEGTQRNQNAVIGLEDMKESVDSLIVVSNDKLLEQFGGISLKDSFMYADKILKQTVRTITDLLAIPALINLDFADVKTVMKDKGNALIGIGRANGEDRAQKASIHAITSPILEASIKGATHAIINISGGDITLVEASKAVETIKAAAGSDLNIIFGVSVVESLANDIQVSVIATGLAYDKVKNTTPEELKEEASTALKTMKISFDNDSTRELLISDPLPDQEKLTITDEIALQESDFTSANRNNRNTSEFDFGDSSDSVDEDVDELPAFLRK